MTKCQQCERLARLFAFSKFEEGQIVYACVKHASTTPKDGITDWMRLPTVKEEK